MNCTVFSELAIQRRILDFGILKKFGLRVNNEGTSFPEHLFTPVVKCLNLSFFFM